MGEPYARFDPRKGFEANLGGLSKGMRSALFKVIFYINKLFLSDH